MLFLEEFSGAHLQFIAHKKICILEEDSAFPGLHCVGSVLLNISPAAAASYSVAQVL